MHTLFANKTILTFQTRYWQNFSVNGSLGQSVTQLLTCATAGQVSNEPLLTKAGRQAAPSAQATVCHALTRQQ